MLNGPCHMHYAYFDGKRVSRHAMKDCRTSLNCKKRYDINKPKQGGKDMIETQAVHLQQINKQQMEPHEDKVNQVKETKMTEDTSHLKDTSL
jgi:hypothetical protein